MALYCEGYLFHTTYVLVLGTSTTAVKQNAFGSFSANSFIIRKEKDVGPV